MKHFITIVLFFFSIKASACYCEKPQFILEFYEAEYVFEGIITSEKETNDDLNYVVTFDIKKHYKKSNNLPKSLQFTLELKKMHDKPASCINRPIRLGEKWLVYAYREKSNELKFNFCCSNTKAIYTKESISEEEQRVLKNGNEFSLEKYIYEFQDNFSKTNLKEEIEIAIKSASIKNYKKTKTTLIIKISKEGKLEMITNDENYTIVVDENFNLIKKILTTRKKELSNFDKEAITILRKINKWDIKYHKKSKIPVSYIKSVIFQYDKKNHTWSYEL